MRRPDLVPDCGSCVALCCVLTSFERGPAFAFDKPAGVPCRHLTGDHACAIHADLVARGCAGCAAYDCYGAGQRASALPEHERAAAFFAIRARHEQLWLLTEASSLLPPNEPGDPLRADIAAEIARLDGGDDVSASTVRALLVRVGDRVRRRRLRIVPG